MHLITKIFLLIVSSLALFFLVFVTFIVPSINNDMDIDYKYSNTGTYIISWENSNYEIQEENWSNSGIWNIKMTNISLWNNIYFQEGNIEEKWENEIHLSQWLYYFDINSLDFNKQIFIEWAEIVTNWPGDFIINTSHSIQNSVYSVSAKIELNLFDINSSQKEGTLLDIYPNMLVMYNPELNKQIVNADLLRVQNVQYINMINTPLYTKITNNNGSIINELNQEIKNYVFFNNEESFNFIENVFSINNYQRDSYQKDFIQLTKNDFYNFPGEKYIIKYYSYFQNDEKKKAYYKNIVLREMITLINSQSNDKTDSIIQNLNILKNQFPNEYIQTIKAIDYYYENLLYSQDNSQSVLLNFIEFYNKVNNSSETPIYTSLLTLRNIYSNYHNGKTEDFHELLNVFINQHKTEMNMSIYDENHRVHNYFLFFLKNILIADFSKVEDHNNIILIFQKYIEIKNIFIEKWNNVTKKTALFDNAELLEVFVNITKINFFKEKRDEKWLLLLLNPALITNTNYQILSENLQKLLDFHIQYQYLIDNSNNRKDITLTESYNKYTTELKEYFLALEDYNQYILEYDTAVINPWFFEDIIDGLKIEDAEEYLNQFTWINIEKTNIEIRDYGYCIQPIEANDKGITSIKDGYCYKITNLAVNWYIFSFNLIPSDNNTINHLLYTDLSKNNFEISTNYIMDTIEEEFERKYSTSQDKDKDRYNFSRFFINTFIENQDSNSSTQVNTDISNADQFIPPSSDWDTLQVRKLKQALLWENSYLKKIRTILPITYDHLIISRENDQYFVNIFPVDLHITLSTNYQDKIFTWKFAWKYTYWSNDSDNTFQDISLILTYLENNWTTRFLLDSTPIMIDDIILTKDIESSLIKLLSPYSKIENIYFDLYEKFPNEIVTINYHVEENYLEFNLSNNYSIKYSMESELEIYENNNKLITIPQDKLLNFLNTLP